MEVNAGSDGTMITGNHAEQNVANGLVVGAISKARIEGNDLMANQLAGLFMFDLGNSLVRENRAVGNGEGLVLDGGQHGSTANSISNNDASGNVHERAGTDQLCEPQHGGGQHRQRQSRRSWPGRGHHLDAVAGNSVTGNVVMGNRDVGIGVFSEKAGDAKNNVLTGNVALANRNHGMPVVAGTTNGGGNFARGNTPFPTACTFPAAPRGAERFSDSP